MNRGLDLAISDWMHQASKFAKLKASRASVSKVLTNKQQRDYDSWLAQALVKLVYNKTTKEHVPQPGRLSKRQLMNHCCLLELERAVEVSNCRARTLNLSFNLCLFDRHFVQVFCFPYLSWHQTDILLVEFANNSLGAAWVIGPSSSSRSMRLTVPRQCILTNSPCQL